MGSLNSFLQLLVAGLATGALYAMVAIGFVLLWQTSGTINFAQGELVMLPAFLMVLFHVVLHWPFWLALVCTMLLCGLFGLAMQRGIIQPLIKQDVLVIVLATLGLSMLLRYAVLVFWTPQVLFFPKIFSTTPIRLGQVVITAEDFWVVVIATGMILALWGFIKYTRLGKAMQAVAQNREAALLVGIRVSSLIGVTFVVNAILTAVAGVLIAPIYFVRWDMGLFLGLKAFYAAIIGGFNQINGALVGGILVGLTETFCSAYLSNSYRDVYVLVFLFLVLMLKPEGLLGVRQARY
ncbi:MAG: branched-chain amino acid ABC transporter permease [Nitrospinota bacterium]|nr:MAG: branched-chain amino acid ABC transporter permease [Nitrospinota bacterium]